jgi:hypothetical protein
MGPITEGRCTGLTTPTDGSGFSGFEFEFKRFLLPHDTAVRFGETEFPFSCADILRF